VTLLDEDLEDYYELTKEEIIEPHKKFIISNIDELKSSILKREIAKEEDLIGYEDRELESIEQ